MATLMVVMPPSEFTPSSESAAPLAEIQIAARLLSDGDVIEALQRLEALSAAVPAYATSQVLLAKAYEAVERWDEALDAWHRAHFLAPGSPLVQRERRRLMDAQFVNVGYESPPVIPPVPVDEWGDEEAMEEVFGIEVGEDDPMNEPLEDAVKPQPIAEDTLVAEPFSPDELIDVVKDSEVHDDEFLDVFVDESEPVSDALGVPIVEETWDDEVVDADETSVKETLVASPEAGSDVGEPLESDSDGDVAWWKRSTDAPKNASEDDVEAGWTVLSEMETEDVRPNIVEGQIVPPIEGPHSNHPKGKGIDGSPDANLAEDLDALIRQLEDAPRIRPDPDFGSAEKDVDAHADEDDADNIVSETLARIYVAQGQFGEAASVYEKLAEQHPELAVEFGEKASELHARVGGSG